MPIDLQSLAKDRREIDFEYGGMSMPVVYKPSVMTGRFAQDMADGTTIDDFAGKLAEMIVDWDLQKGGKKMPVTPETIAELPTALAAKLLSDINADSGLNNPEGKVTTNRAGRRTRTTSTASNGTS